MAAITVLGAAVPVWRKAAAQVSGAVADVSGWLAGRVLAVVPSLPGVAGAAAVSVCAGFAASHVFGHGLAPWVGGLVGGVFALALDRRM